MKKRTRTGLKNKREKLKDQNAEALHNLCSGQSFSMEIERILF